MSRRQLAFWFIDAQGVAELRHHAARQNRRGVR